MRGVARELDQAELDVLDASGRSWRDRRSARSACAARCACSPRTVKLRAAARDRDVERRLDLPQVLVERAAQVARGAGCRPASSVTSTGLSSRIHASSPRSECGSAAVMRTSTKWPISARGAGKVHARGCSRCGPRARASLLRDAFDQHALRACRPSRSLIACVLASSCACSRCSRCVLHLVRRRRRAARRPACRGAGCR